MKKRLLLVIAMIMAITLFVPNVMAETVAKIGNTEYSSLAEAIKDAKGGETVNIVSSVTLTEMISVEEDITIDGGNNTITSSADKIFEIYGRATNPTNATIKNVVMEMTADKARCIDTRTGSINLTLNKVTLKTTSKDNNQPITIGNTYRTGESNNIINLENTTIEAGVAGYGIIVFNPITLNINNSDIEGYAALYMKGVKGNTKGSDGSIVDVKNSTLASTNIHSGASNNFGTIAFEDDNITINIENSKLEANSTAASLNAIFSNSSTTVIEKPIAVNVKGDSKIIVNVSNDTTEDVIKRNDIDITIYKDVTSNIDAINDYLAEGLNVIRKDGEYIATEIVTITLVVEFADVSESLIGELPKGYVLTKDELKEFEDIQTKINEYLKEEGLNLVFKGFYLDKEGKTKVDFTKAINEDATWYLIIGEPVKELPPKTSDINIILLVSTILISGIGVVIAAKKRFAKNI